MQKNSSRDRAGKLRVIGIGPGSPDGRTAAASEGLKKSGVFVGYHKYTELIKDVSDAKKIISNGMRQERERVRKAIDLALEGEEVALISSGDSGVYGMAGLVYEIVSSEKIDLDIEVIPGITAANSAAALLGAPLMCDYSVISLSDLLIPWEVIEKRLIGAASSDMVTVLYNPQSSKRKKAILDTQKIFLKYQDGGIPVGLVQGISLENENITLATLEDFTSCDIDMRTVVIIGNSRTFTYKGKMITGRGYRV